MAILWNGSLVPWVNEAEKMPYSGARAYFFDFNTTTPLIVYTDYTLSIPHDHPVVANAAGMFPPIFIPEQTTYRVRITDADDVTIWDVDGISAPTTVTPDPPEGDTPAEFLFRTGDIKIAWRTSSPTGFVRLNGRTIGSGSSSATERANADCEDLFIHLWEEDANLAVSGGRGATSAGDWAAAKTIALPDWRGRAPVGLDGMGNSAAGRITDAQFGSDTDALGSAGGSSTHTLVSGELPTITPTFTGAALPAHGHPFRSDTGADDTTDLSGGFMIGDDGTLANQPAFAGTPSNTLGEQIGGQSAGTPAGTISSFGSDDPHNNVQPSILVPFFIKL